MNTYDSYQVKVSQSWCRLLFRINYNFINFILLSQTEILKIYSSREILLETPQNELVPMSWCTILSYKLIVLMYESLVRSPAHYCHKSAPFFIVMAASNIGAKSFGRFIMIFITGRRKVPPRIPVRAYGLKLRADRSILLEGISHEMIVNWSTLMLNT